MTIQSPDQPVPSFEEMPPRRGLVPFEQDVDLTSDRVLSGPMPAGTLGNARLSLDSQKPDYDPDPYDNWGGFTFDEGGNIIEGRLKDFYDKGYYDVTPILEITDSSQTAPITNLQFNAWLEGAVHVASVTMNSKPFMGERMIGENSPSWKYEMQDGKKGSRLFVLPRDNNVISKLRVNFSQENEPEVREK